MSDIIKNNSLKRSQKKEEKRVKTSGINRKQMARSINPHIKG